MKWPSHEFFTYMRIQQNIERLRNILDGSETSEVGLSFNKPLFTRCENSTQNLGCSKTSTSNTFLTDEMSYSHVFCIQEISAKHWKGGENIWDRSETSGEGLSFKKMAFH